MNYYIYNMYTFNCIKNIYVPISSFRNKKKIGTGTYRLIFQNIDT